MPGVRQDNVAVKGPKVVRPVEPEDKQLLLVVVLYQVGKHRGNIHGVAAYLSPINILHVYVYSCL